MGRFGPIINVWAISNMTLTRDDALSFLNRLATDSRPLVGFTVARWGLSLFIGSIVHLEPEYLIINQADSGHLLPFVVYLSADVTFEYGDTRELTNRISAELLNQEPTKTNVAYLQSLIEGAIVMQFNEQTEAVGLVELDPEHFSK